MQIAQFQIERRLTLCFVFSTPASLSFELLSHLLEKLIQSVIWRGRHSTMCVVHPVEWFSSRSRYAVLICPETRYEQLPVGVRLSKAVFRENQIVRSCTFIEVLPWPNFG